MTEQLTFSIKTLGCKVNRYESELLAANIRHLGLRQSAFPETDIILINACSVTQKSESKIRHELSRASRNPNAQIIFCGCISDNLNVHIAGIKHVRIHVVKNPDKVQAVMQTLHDMLLEKGADSSLHESPLITSLRSFPHRTRAFIKIQDGCQSFCSYCIIPYMRNFLWSRKPDEIVEEIRQMENSGHKEIVLTGIHVGKYSYEQTALADLIRNILEKTDIPRIRLSSIEPLEISSDLIKLFAGEARLCPHLHIPLQSASDPVLKRMNRHYTLTQYLTVVKKLRKNIPDLSLTTDIIIGFPGETRHDFEISLKAVRNTGFLKTHIFPYSSRPGTEASRFDDQLPVKTIFSRKKAMKTAAEHSAEQEKKKWLGKTCKVLFEQTDKRKPHVYTGFSSHYIKVQAHSEKNVRNQIHNVILKAMDKKGHMIGDIQNENLSY